MNLIDLKKIRKIHFIGIGGIGMRGIAELMLNWGYEISGSDLSSSENTEYLESCGANIIIGHSSFNIHNPDLVVYSAAVPENNIELVAARNCMIPVIKRSEMLGLITKLKQYCIAVCGTHGKTTTTAMISKIFEIAGFDPVTIVGGIDNNIGTTTRCGKGNIIIIEADEYDRSFLKINPTHVVVTTIDLDHIEDYDSLENTQKTFREFISFVPQNGAVVLNNDDINSKAIAPHIYRSYAINETADVRATKIAISTDRTEFIVNAGTESWPVSLKIHGHHNIQNALAAISIALEFDISLETICHALATFQNVDRRMQIMHESENLILMDDYAHHPTEIIATLSAINAKWRRRTIAVFQPHLYSRTQNFYKQFADALLLADIVIITGIYPAREDSIPGVSGQLIVNEFSRGDRIVYIENKLEVADFLKKIVVKGDLIITMGAGDIGTINNTIKTFIH